MNLRIRLFIVVFLIGSFLWTSTAYADALGELTRISPVIIQARIEKVINSRNEGGHYTTECEVLVNKVFKGQVAPGQRLKVRLTYPDGMSKGKDTLVTPNVERILFLGQYYPQDTLSSTDWLFGVQPVVSSLDARLNTIADRVRTKPKDDEWKIWIDDGKSDSPIAETRPVYAVKQYVQTLCGASGVDLPKWAERNLSKEGKPIITRIGQWGQYTVHDVSDSSDKKTYPLGIYKLILLCDEQDRLRLLYYGSLANINLRIKPELRAMNGETILTFQTRSDGTGGGEYEYYWSLDRQTGLPKQIDQHNYIEILRRVFPSPFKASSGR